MSATGSQDASETHALSGSIVQELVAPQVSFKTLDIQTIGILQSVYARKLDREADFVACILGSILVDGLGAAARSRRGRVRRRGSACAVFVYIHGRRGRP